MFLAAKAAIEIEIISAMCWCHLIVKNQKGIIPALNIKCFTLQIKASIKIKPN
jgi:hypothetical protein